MGWHTMLDLIEAAARGEAPQERMVYTKKNAALDNLHRDALSGTELEAHRNFRFVEADVLDLPRLTELMAGCTHVVHAAGGVDFWEVPVGTARFAGTNLPFGGGFLRLLPLALVRAALASVNRVDRRPAVLYVHPWELDPGQPRPAMPWLHRVRHYAGLASTERKLDRLLAEFRFTSVDRAFATPAQPLQSVNIDWACRNESSRPPISDSPPSSLRPTTPSSARISTERFDRGMTTAVSALSSPAAIEKSSFISPISTAFAAGQKRGSS